MVMLGAWSCTLACMLTLDGARVGLGAWACEADNGRMVAKVVVTDVMPIVLCRVVGGLVEEEEKRWGQWRARRMARARAVSSPVLAPMDGGGEGAESRWALCRLEQHSHGARIVASVVGVAVVVVDVVVAPIAVVALGASRRQTRVVCGGMCVWSGRYCFFLLASWPSSASSCQSLTALTAQQSSRLASGGHLPACCAPDATRRARVSE